MFLAVVAVAFVAAIVAAIVVVSVVVAGSVISFCANISSALWLSSLFRLGGPLPLPFNFSLLFLDGF